MKTPTDDSLDQFILDGAGRCVACGLCLPWCPTYQLDHSEFESPRGRLALLQALARSELEKTASTVDLLDHCLLCRTCEKHCPSSVPFGDIMDAGRRLALQAKPRAAGLSRKLAEFALHRPEWLRRFAYPVSMLSKLIPSGTVLKPVSKRSIRSLSYLPSVQTHAPWQVVYPAKQGNRGQIALFVGCAARVMDARTIDDTIKALTLQGFEVVIPPEQACCGALSLHEGRHETALNFMRTNLSAFAGNQIDSIIHMATGCGVTLNEYSQNAEDHYSFTDKLNEICTFINQNWLDSTCVNPSEKHVMLHTPCSSLDTDGPKNLLRHIPGLRVTELRDDYSCCGAAGTYMLSRPLTAAALRTPLIEQIQAVKPDVVATTNPGCALHLAEGLRAAGLKTTVLHPVSVLVDQLT